VAPFHAQKNGGSFGGNNKTKRAEKSVVWGFTHGERLSHMGLAESVPRSARPPGRCLRPCEKGSVPRRRPARCLCRGFPTVVPFVATPDLVLVTTWLGFVSPLGGGTANVFVADVLFLRLFHAPRRARGRMARTWRIPVLGMTFVVSRAGRRCLRRASSD
jgi:hypothetical protein